jgi:hypothetical protein
MRIGTENAFLEEVALAWRQIVCALTKLEGKAAGTKIRFPDTRLSL